MAPAGRGRSPGSRWEGSARSATPRAIPACSERRLRSRALLHPLGDADFLLGLFSAFTPDPKAIRGDPESDRDVWARHDPTELAARLRGTPLFVSSGNGRPGPLDSSGASGDRIEPTVLRESRAFVTRLHELGIPVRADFHGAGIHDWPYWERELRRALPMLLAGLDAR